MFIQLLLVSAHVVSRSEAYPSFQDQIPNGHNIPDPCNPSIVWSGVGHQNSKGGGVRNQFGLHLAAHNFVWTKSLCQLDSDGDGRTNGEELGDPNCVWSAGNTPTVTTGLSHPGVCDPVSSALCHHTNSWLSCQRFSCPAFTQPGVLNMSLLIPRTAVPAQTTTYICMDFALPNDTDYQIIGHMPAIDNANVMHHILMYGCMKSDNRVPDSEPYSCSMGGKCRSMIGLWGVGVPGECLPDQFGFPMGPNGFQMAVLEFHWNNPSHVSTYTDNSGLTIFYTANQRPYEGGILMVGQNHLEIPPGLPAVTFGGACTSRCTQALTQSINITDAALHMHLTGQSGSINLYRNQKLLTTLTTVEHYDYNSPVLTRLATPATLLPGDEIKLTCVYNSTDRLTTTYYGDSTSDEMCYGFLTYYAAVKQFTSCGEWRSLDYCSLVHLPLKNCDQPVFSILMEIMKHPLVSCDYNCSKVCQLLIEDAYSTGCLDGDNGLRFNRSRSLHPILKVVGRCKSMMPTTTRPTTIAPSTCPTGSQTKMSASIIGIVGVLIIAICRLLSKL